MTKSPDSITIEFDPASKAFYAGVAAGAEAGDQVAGLDPGTLFTAKLQYFWLKVGTVLAQAVPEASDELVARFVQGAALRVPEERRAVEVVIKTTDTPAFGAHGEDFDEEKAREEIARLLRFAADQVAEGWMDGELTDAADTRVGHFKVNLYT